jgi:hypothetical protein
MKTGRRINLIATSLGVAICLFVAGFGFIIDYTLLKEILIVLVVVFF